MTTKPILPFIMALALAAPARAGELLVLSGDEPLRTKINEQPGVNLIFLGSPT